jgi:hypothetical protein
MPLLALGYTELHTPLSQAAQVLPQSAACVAYVPFASMLAIAESVIDKAARRSAGGDVYVPPKLPRHMHSVPLITSTGLKGHCAMVAASSGHTFSE